MQYKSPHSFHIPVMGLAYTIDSPVKVARFGISSVISIVEDRLVEMMRQHYHSILNEPCIPISTREHDYRAKRITGYLNLVNRVVQEQVENVRNASFEPGSEIVKYFEMLPDNSKLKQLYLAMINSKGVEKDNMQAWLRIQVAAGSIDVNIMTKTDRNNFTRQGDIIPDGSDAVAALRGYANSDLTNSAVIFSAGMNPRLYNYLEKCSQFDADENGNFKKRIVIKVSDYRSALIQGKYLAKKGIWVSEFRIESGINCGGHAFATDGYLLGPVMEEFREKKEELISTMFSLYRDALVKKNAIVPVSSQPVLISVQGGIGTSSEDMLLHSHYNINSTGWGSPFLLVPEATTVDDVTLDLLCKADKEDVQLSRNSPLGVRIYSLKGTTSEKEKADRIKKGKPGSPCTEKHLEFDTEFTSQPICTASHKYQKLKIEQLDSKQLSAAEHEKQLSNILNKECLCVGLSNAAAIVYKKPFIRHLEAVSICPGPNIAHFSKVVSLQTMTDHIYGRTDIIQNSRPHMFIAELFLYIEYLQEEIENEIHADAKKLKYFETFCRNLSEGIAHYRKLDKDCIENRHLFEMALSDAENKIKILATAVAAI